MKKILRGPVKYRIKCHYCDCEFEYQSEDIMYGHVDILRCSAPSMFSFVECPSCGYRLLHEDSFSSSTSASIDNTDTMKL